MSTWCDAIDAGHLSSFPAITSAQVRKYFPDTVATHMGHLDQSRQGQLSTKQRPHYHRDLYLKLINTEMAAPTVPHRPGTIYSDPTGRFITRSSQGNLYILVVYDADSNYIFAEPTPSRSAHQMVQAYDKIQSLLISRGIIPYIHIMDNETSTVMKDYLTKKGIQYQFVPPQQHRANAAERAIRTFQNHFIAILCSCDPSFPLHLWDRLLPQAVITLNLLRTSTINDRLSAYAQVHGAFNFSSTPLGPPGTKVIVHEKPSQRGTWSPHGVEGWYLGPALDHYRNFVVYIPSTKSIRISDTLVWLPSNLIMPTASSTDLAMAAAFDLTQALLHPSPASALSPLSDSQRQALYELATIFGHAVTPPTEPSHPITVPMDQDIASTVDVVPRVDPVVVPRVEPTLVPRVEPAIVTRVEPTLVPRVEPAILPRVDHVESGVTKVHWAEPLSSLMGEPLSSPLTTNVPLTNTDLSYSRYTHNGAQRRRQDKQRTRIPRPNRRHRNPVPTQPAPNLSPPLILTHPPVITETPAPITTTTPAHIPNRRRSTRGTKIARFDPKNAPPPQLNPIGQCLA